MLLIVDQRSTMFFGSRHAMKSVAAAEVAALSAWRATSLGDRVGAVVFGDAEIVEVKPQARDVGATRVIGEVVRQNLALANGPVPGQGNPDGLNEALRRAQRLATHDWLVCLITDVAGAGDETKHLVTQISAHNDVLTVFISDPLEAQLPDVGKAVFSFGDRKIEVDTGSDKLTSRFATTRAEWSARVTDLSRRRAIPVLPISTERDVADQLRELIGRAVSRRSGSRR